MNTEGNRAWGGVGEGAVNYGEMGLVGNVLTGGFNLLNSLIIPS